MDIKKFLGEAVITGASDMFVVAGLPVKYKIGGSFTTRNEEVLLPEATAALIGQVYEEAGRKLDINSYRDDDFSVTIPGLSRFRVNVYRQRGSLAMVVRVIRFALPNPEKIGIPQTVMELADRRKGLVLVTGTAGSGKSTTLACFVDRVNSTRQEHIVTLEDPLEYMHKHKKSIISQREISTDTDSYLTALRASLRQAPDVIMLGEMRDHETISVAMTAAETGHLVFSSLHTVSASSTMDRVIDVFPANQQSQVRTQLALVLQAVVSQQLVPGINGGAVPAFEIMIANNAIRNLIRESKLHQIDSIIHSSSQEGMTTMDSSLASLYKQGLISKDSALVHSPNPDLLAKRLEA